MAGGGPAMDPTLLHGLQQPLHDLLRTTSLLPGQRRVPGHASALVWRP